MRGPLGFGTSALVGGRTRREALRLLACALDAGINHFDVARVYGTGDAEAIVGAFVAPHRDRVTITTKFGLHPLARSPLTDVAKRVVRLAARRSPRLLRAARRHSGHTISRGDFSPENARASLHTSLGELGIETVDAYLLHDCGADDWDNPTLQEALAGLVEQGLVRAIGTATSRADTLEILTRRHPPAVAQFDSCTLAPGPLAELRRAGCFTVTFAPLSRALPVLIERVAQRPEVAARWSRELDLDAASTDTLADLLLADALDRNPNGVVLYATGKAGRIQHAARLAAEPPFAERQLASFRTLAAAIVEPA
jgi:D-threo-aldose 1-dehydrogenase